MEVCTGDLGQIPWNEYVQDKLLSTNCGLTGVALLTKEGVCVYSYGKLVNDKKQDWSTIIHMFTENLEGNNTKLSLFVDSATIDFVPFKTTLSSVYGVCAGDRHRLVACSFPLGVLVCINEPPTPMSNAVKYVENFCAGLRT